jgi:DNA-3-methyladenine glycosylase II
MRLDSDAAMEQALAELGAADPVMARLVAQGARPALRKREPGFAALAWIVVGQQVSTASATAIWTRVQERLGSVTAETVAAADDALLKSAGLSAPKIRTLRALAEAVVGGTLPLDALADRPADETHAALTAVKGIGPWTADIYLLFCLGHPDAFPAGDLAVQEAARLAYRLDARPTAKALEAMAEAWRPWRGAAARVLWAYYRITKEREGVVG